MDLYTIYDYVRLPLQIEEDSLNITETSKPFFSIEVDNQCKFELYHPPQSLANWCLSDNPFGKGYRISVQKMWDGNRVLPHIDGKLEPELNVYPREFAINYLLSESGPSTEWYKTQDPNSVYESVVFPSHTWHKIRTDILHGVRNIQSPRIAITMVINYDIETISKYREEYELRNL